MNAPTHDKMSLSSSPLLWAFGIVLTSGLLGHVLLKPSTSVSTQVDSIDIQSWEFSSTNPGFHRQPIELKDPKTQNAKSSDKPKSILFNDLSVQQKWGLSLTQSDQAWRISQGSRDIVIAVIDTGIDIQHPDLKDNLWRNPGESGLDSQGRDKASNNIDDDGNGFVDDVYGWNFVASNNDLTDNHGHGTHISGIIGATGRQKGGALGVAPNVSLMTLKYYDPKAPGSSNLMNTVRAIHYAIDNGAHIINYSGGGLDPSQEERKAIERAQKAGILVVAAAGNESSNSDVRKYYPADYELDNIISVTAFNQQTTVLPTSNYGVNSVHIAAPGNEIRSTLPGSRYGTMTGTSQATAFVSGVAALIMANNRNLSPHQVVRFITQTGDLDQNLAGKTRYQRRLNSYRALSILDQGIAANGAIAENTRNMRETRFVSDEDRVRTSDIGSNLNTTSVAEIKDFNQELRGHLRSVLAAAQKEAVTQDKP